MSVFTYSLAGIYSFVWVTECASSAETEKIQISVVVHAFASVTDFIFEIQMACKVRISKDFPRNYSVVA